MVNIKILGPGCANCKRLEALVSKVVAAHNIQAEIEKVTDYNEIMKWPILSTPGLVINEKVVHAGSVPDKAKVVSLITSALV